MTVFLNDQKASGLQGVSVKSCLMHFFLVHLLKKQGVLFHRTFVLAVSHQQGAAVHLSPEKLLFLRLLPKLETAFLCHQVFAPVTVFSFVLPKLPGAAPMRGEYARRLQIHLSDP